MNKNLDLHEEEAGDCVSRIALRRRHHSYSWNM